MADQDLKSRAWRAELPALDTLLSTAELDAPPPGLEARLLRRLREAEPFEAAPIPAEAGGAPPDSAAVAAEPVRTPSLEPTGLRAQRLWVGLGSALVAAAVAGLFLRAARDAGDVSGQVNDRRSIELPVSGRASPNAPTACTGTYLIRASNGALNFWTFHPEGTLLGTSPGGGDGSLSTLHGSWRAEGPLRARALQLGLRVAARGTFAGVERVDITIRGEGGGCDTVAGESSRRVFRPGQDFLHPDEDSGDAVRFTGFRVAVKP